MMLITLVQFDFSSLFVTSSAVDGAIIHIRGNGSKSQTQFTRTFKPDFVLIRQRVCYLDRDYRSILISLIHGGTKGIVDLWTTYTFSDVALLACRLNDVAMKHSFPLIPGDFFCSLQDIHGKISSSSMEYPIILKLGNHKRAIGLIKLDDVNDLENVLNLMASTNSYCFIQEYVVTNYEIIVYKIGAKYCAFSRTSLDGTWNISSSKIIIEEIDVVERYKEWLEELAGCFEGLHICGLQILVSNTNREIIIGAYDSTISLLGDKKEEDYKSIANVSITAIENALQLRKATGSKIDRIAEDPELVASTPTNDQPGSLGGDDSSQKGKVPKKALQRSSSGSRNKDDTSLDEVTSVKEEDAEDTMKNLRKTFAGIFGEM